MPDDKDMDEKLGRLLYRFIGSMEHVPDKLDLLDSLINELKLRMGDYKTHQDTFKEDYEKVKQLFFEFKKEYRETYTNDEKVSIEYKNGTDKLLDSHTERLDQIDKANEKTKKNYKDILMWITGKLGYIIVAGITAYVTLKIKGGLG